MSKQQQNKAEDDLRTFREIFQLVDRDGGGSIQQDELGTLLRTLGLKPTDEEITEMMKEAYVVEDDELMFSK